jgi:8-oxo-dGTP pyrophosphatase MutT (NUDIX family)
MDPRLTEYLARCTKVGPESEVVWGNGTLPLRIQTYLTNDLPPLEFVNSVRSLVFQDSEILVLRNRDGLHILPGGRREMGETLEETAKREVREESGWEIDRLRLLGLYHFHHLSPKPADYPYLYPDFLNIVYVSEASDFGAEAKVPDEYEIEARFRPVEDVLLLYLPENVFLMAAQKSRATD